MAPSTKKKRDEKKANKICFDCYEPATVGGYCRFHADKKNERHRRRRIRYAEQGRCVSCSRPLNKEVGDTDRLCQWCMDRRDNNRKLHGRQ